MSITKEYQGFLKTPYLFNESNDLPFDVFSVPLSLTRQLPVPIKQGLRLGNRVEQYVYSQLEVNHYEILAKNFQIIKEGKTLGEIDCIISKNDVITHLEIVCKFYLYDKTVGQTELAHWIGPNRKDSLIEKIKKLHLKQLPLCFSKTTKDALKSIGVQNIDRQEVFFIGQLFVPYGSKGVNFHQINSACVAGSYIAAKDIDQLNQCQFYLPSKEEWLQSPNPEVAWGNIEEVKEKIAPLLLNEKSPMCWVKSKFDKIEKVFITWW